MPTQLEVYNLALNLLKETKLASLSEAREARYVLDDWWSQTRSWMLESGFWKFALRTAKITQDTSIVPEFGPPMAHNKPEDWVRTYLLSANDRLDPPLEDWLEEIGNIFCEVTPIYIRYVSNDVNYGLDTDRWTARFTQAFAARLAANTCGKITGSSEGLKDKLDKEADAALSIALSFEAMREPNRRPPEGKWNQARRGGRSRSDWYRYA